MNDFREIYEALDKIKISVVMQVNLENYKGSRKDPINKFHRAVESFKNQTYKNCELIIVADGCNKTHQLYSRSHKDAHNIKFVYLDRTGSMNMYEELRDGSKYYRGEARKIGVAAATGDLIMYMDSDDFLMPNFVMTGLLYYNANPEKDWWVNLSWYDHESIQLGDHNSKAVMDPSNTESVEIEGLPERWKAIDLLPGTQILTPWLMMHRSSLNTRWRDILSKTISEDVDFFKRLQTEYPNGSAYKAPNYVRCHFADKWDI